MSEKSEARRDGARLQRNSGRGQYSKGDAIDGPFVVDYKDATKSFSLNIGVWSKICTDTIRVDRSKHPLLRITLGEGKSKVRLDILERDVVKQLVEDRRKLDILLEQLQAHPEIYDTMMEYING